MSNDLKLTRNILDSFCLVLTLHISFAYRCPRFLLHHQTEQISSSSSQSSSLLPNVFRIYSASSPIPGAKARTYTSPQTPSHTPTFRRIHMTAPVYQTSPTSSAQGSATTLSGLPATSRSHSCMLKANSSPTTGGRRRKMAPQESIKADSKDSRTIEAPAKRMAASASRYSQLAKYSTRQWPDPNSQCASRMGSQGYHKKNHVAKSLMATPLTGGE